MAAIMRISELIAGISDGDFDDEATKEFHKAVEAVEAGHGNGTVTLTKDGHASATKMLETARNLVINVGSKYQRTIDPTTGTGTLIVKDEHDEATSTKIPKSFALAIPVFEGDDTHYIVEALVRFTMAEGRPQFAYILQNKEKVLEDALAELRNKVAAGTGAPVFVGTPPAAAR